MFRYVLAEQWESLSPVLQRRYAIKNGMEFNMQGVLEVKHGKLIKLLMPLIRLTGALVPVEGENFLVKVKNHRIGNTFYWHRTFQKDNKIYCFNSKMQQFDNDIVEFVGFGIGIRMGLNVVNGGIVYNDKGYVIKIANKLIPIPLHWLVGRFVIEEYASQDDSNNFTMQFKVKHPCFGLAFSYQGYFNCN